MSYKGLYQKFCSEFDRALADYANEHADAIEDKNGNWFGRLIGYQYQIEFLGKTYQDDKKIIGVRTDEFRDRIRHKTIKIKSFQTDMDTVKFYPNEPFNPLAGIIEAQVEIQASVDGDSSASGTYLIRHFVQPVYQAIRTESTKHGSEAAEQSGEAEPEEIDSKLMAELEELSANYDPTNPDHKFCWEFGQSLLKFTNSKDPYGNWFGRLVGFGYVFEANNYRFTEVNQNDINIDEFRQKIRDKEIRFNQYATDFNSVRRTGDVIYARVYIVASDLGLREFYNVQYKVRNTGIQATEIKIT